MLALNQVSLRRGVKLVLDQASVVLQPGEKVGLVGRNGAGKSSLFSLLTHRLQSDAGDVAMPPRWRIGEVAQDMPETDQGATEFVLEGDTRLMEAQAQLVQAELIDDGHAMADAHHAISDSGGFDARPRAQAMLLGLGFKMAELDAPVNMALASVSENPSSASTMLSAFTLMVISLLVSFAAKLNAPEGKTPP